MFPYLSEMRIAQQQGDEAIWGSVKSSSHLRFVTFTRDVIGQKRKKKQPVWCEINVGWSLREVRNHVTTFQFGHVTSFVLVCSLYSRVEDRSCQSHVLSLHSDFLSFFLCWLLKVLDEKQLTGPDNLTTHFVQHLFDPRDPNHPDMLQLCCLHKIQISSTWFLFPQS